MIGFNGKYLAAAAIGDMRITAMGQGAYDLLGTFSWLVKATKAAILSAFGAEGAGVIQATNAYLNGLATTDREKAQRLANCINEDPMLVCSIVETSKTRWLVGGSKAFIKTGVYATQNSGAYIEFKALRTDNTETGLLTVDKAANNQAFGVSRWNGKFQFWYGTHTGATSLSMLENVVYKYSQMKGVISVQGSNGDEYSNSLSLAGSIFDGEFFFPSTSRNNSQTTTGGAYNATVLKLYDNDQPVREMYPFIRNGECGMIDILTGTFHPNANTEGAFTIALTDKP